MTHIWRGALSPELVERCAFMVRIPTRFCINVASAGAVLMYDRMISQGRFAERPVGPHSKTAPLPNHVFGAPVIRSKP